MAVLYLLAHIDRGNIGNAKIEGIDKDLGLVGNQYNIASTIFFVPYVIFGTSMESNKSGFIIKIRSRDNSGYHHNSLDLQDVTLAKKKAGLPGTAFSAIGGISPTVSPVTRSTPCTPPSCKFRA
jgi:hypothetical protein